MAYVVTNMSDKPIELAAGVFIEPGEQLNFNSISDDLWQLHQEGKLRILSSDETFEERKADADAFTPRETR